MMYNNLHTSKKLAPLLRQAFRQGVEAASRNEDRNPYVPDSHFYHAWIAGWATLARGWDNDDLRPSADCGRVKLPVAASMGLSPPALGIGVESD